MLKQPLLARGISARYVTSSIGDKAGFVDTLVNNSRALRASGGRALTWHRSFDLARCRQAPRSRRRRTSEC